MKRTGAWWLIGGGVVTIGAVWLAMKKSQETETQVETAILNGGRVNVRLTGYWPFTARADEQRMEGGTKDRKGRPLYTLEQHLSDPDRYPYVSLSGDDAIWPYGQRLALSPWPRAVFRVVDTGSHFRGAGKIYRVAGYEPIDVCVDSSKTVVPKLAEATIVKGDNFAGGKAVATAGLRDQTVTA